MSATLVSREVLASLTGTGQSAAMRRWFDAHNWIYESDRKGRPQVAQAYFDAKMTGAPMPGAARATPRLDFFSAA